MKTKKKRLKIIYNIHSIDLKIFFRLRYRASDPVFFAKTGSSSLQNSRNTINVFWFAQYIFKKKVDGSFSMGLDPCVQIGFWCLHYKRIRIRAFSITRSDQNNWIHNSCYEADCCFGAMAATLTLQQWIRLVWYINYNDLWIKYMNMNTMNKCKNVAA